MLKKATEAIEHYKMLQKGGHVLIGVSGGADSMALLHLFKTLQSQWQLSLLAVHIHHGLRKEDADRDAALVEETCHQWDIACRVVRVDVAGEARRRHMGEEETGRLLRYQFFSELASPEGVIAVAHHQDDQAETVLMQLCRGAGLTGLCGMRPVRGQVIRPLLMCSRKEIEAYCQQNTIPYTEDVTNQSLRYTRNKLRHVLLPWLKTEVNAKSAEHIAHTARLLAEDADFLNQLAQNAWESCLLSRKTDIITLDRAKTAALPKPLRTRVLQIAISDILGSTNGIAATHLTAIAELLTAESGKRLSLSRGLSAETSYAALILSKANQKTDKPHSFCKTLVPEQAICLKSAQKTVLLSFKPEKKNDVLPPSYTQVLDYDRIKGILSCRTRQAGDWMMLENGHRKKLKDLWIDAKVPRQQRENTLLIACGSEIIWALGFRISSNFLAKADTKHKIWVQIWEETGNEGNGGSSHLKLCDSKTD